jgi:hypothetical protein
MIFMNYILILTPSDNVIFSQSSSDMYLFRKYCHMTLGLRGREYHRNYDHHFVHLFSRWNVHSERSMYYRVSHSKLLYFSIFFPLSKHDSISS